MLLISSRSPPEIDSTSHSPQPAVAFATEPLAGEPDLRNPPVLREHGIVSLLNVPIDMDGVVWGVLEVDSETPGTSARTTPTSC